MRAKLRESVLLGGLSFVVPFAATLLVARYPLGWDWRAAEIAGAAMSTTSLAVVYAVLVETGLNQTGIGKAIMAATFVTDIGTATALTSCSSSRPGGSCRSSASRSPWWRRCRAWSAGSSTATATA
jgi:Kef-type K+ transport system membrane component KefB